MSKLPYAEDGDPAKVEMDLRDRVQKEEQDHDKEHQTGVVEEVKVFDLRVHLHHPDLERGKGMTNDNARRKTAHQRMST